VVDRVLRVAAFLVRVDELRAADLARFVAAARRTVVARLAAAVRLFVAARRLGVVRPAGPWAAAVRVAAPVAARPPWVNGLWLRLLNRL
jgi:hypothetical protein